MKKEKILSVVILVLLISALIAINNTVYQINPSRCNGCRNCLYSCDNGAITYSNSTHKCKINANLCEGCGDCVDYCNRSAIYRTVVAGEDVVLPQSEMKLNVYPNPVKTDTQIAYTLPKGSDKAILRVFNVKGEVLGEWKLDNKNGSIQWNKKDLANGTYFTQIISGKEKLTKKIIVVK